MPRGLTVTRFLVGVWALALLARLPRPLPPLRPRRALPDRAAAAGRQAGARDRLRGARLCARRRLARPRPPRPDLGGLRLREPGVGDGVGDLALLGVLPAARRGGAGRVPGRPRRARGAPRLRGEARPPPALGAPARRPGWRGLVAPRARPDRRAA